MEKNNTLLTAAVVLSGLTLLMVGYMATSIDGKVSSAIEKIEQQKVGGAEAYKKLTEFYSTQEFQSAQLKEIQAQIDNFKKANPSLGGSSSSAQSVAQVAQPGKPTLENIKLVATQVGIDATKLEACVKENKKEGAVQEQQQLGSSLFQINGTPGNVLIDTTTMNYVFINGAYPKQAFDDAIKALKAQKKGDKAPSVSYGGQAFTANTLSKENYDKLTKAAKLLGAATPRIIFLEFSDIECPFCKRNHQNGTIASVRSENKDLAYSVMHFPLSQIHPLAQDGAEALECAYDIGGKEKYDAFESAVFKI